MFKTISSKIYAIVIFFTIIFAINYGLLAYFLKEQGILANQMLERSHTQIEMHQLHDIFYELHFWEQKVMDGKNPKAIAIYGSKISAIKTKLNELQETNLSESIRLKLSVIRSGILEHEKIFNNIIQLETTQTLHRTSLNTSYRSIISNILNNNMGQLFKPLFNLTQFFIDYIMNQDEPGYQSLIIVSDYLGKKIEPIHPLDERTKSYLSAFKRLLQEDHKIVIQMDEIEAQFEIANNHLFEQFDNVFMESIDLFNRKYNEAQSKRYRLNHSALFMTIVSVLLLIIIFYMFARTVVAPIRTLAAVMRNVKGGNVNDRFDWLGKKNDELIEYGYHFNAMLDSLQESEKKYEDLFKSSLDAIFLLDPDQGYIDCNQAAMDMFTIRSKDQLKQISPGDILSHTHLKDTSGTDQDWNIIEKIEKTAAISELTFCRIDGKEFYGNMRVTRIKVGAQTIVQKTIRDITETKKAQEMMIQSEKMLSVGGLAAGMAHEINNPLAGMIQSANVVRSRLEKIEMTANLKAAEEIGIQLEDIKAFMEKRGIFRMLDGIHESGIRAAEIVNSMLSFARKSNVAFSPHYPDQLMDKILELAATDYDLKKQYDFKSIEIVKQYDENLPVLICEGTKIQQVFLNILRNGAQAMQTANVEFPRFILKIYKEIPPTMVCIEIQDNGPGMDEETRSKVFDPFFTTKPVGVGTGLGLSVSYFIITENHKGTMEVISEPGKGASFIIRLPIETKSNI